MPIIASQHRWKDAHHTPSARWPADCLVQWGSSGIVFARGSGRSYRTAFFEAFPGEGGFIRGEGPTLRQAEANALKRFRREAACRHRWGRRGYSNGAGRCIGCGAFRSDVFPPIRTLDAWRKPLTDIEIDAVASGFTQPLKDDDAKTGRYRRRLLLKARLAGIEVPHPHSGNPDGTDCIEAHAEACEQAVRNWLATGPRRRDPVAEGALEGLFDRVSRQRVDDLQPVSAPEDPGP